MLFLDSQNQVLAYEPLFKGTVDAAVVYPRVVVQLGLGIERLGADLRASAPVRA